MNLPPYISRTPPPLNDTEDDEDEEFGTFAVCSDLGEEVCDAFENNSNITRGDDNVSEDSGFCMNSVCQTQSPCDASPLSSSYYKVNECMSIENHGNIADSSPKETESSKSEDLKLNDSCYDHSSFTQEFETFQSDEIDVESSQEEKPEFSKNSFENEISNSNINVNGIETVNTIDSNAINIVTSTPVNENLNISHVVNEINFQESLKTNEAGWFSNSCEEVVGDSCSSIKHSNLTNKHFELQNESSPYVQDAASDLQYPEFPITSYSEKSTKYFDSDNANEENIDNVDNWGSEDDDFSDFTSFKVVESDSEISRSKYEFQFGESEIATERSSELIYEKLQSVIESNCVWNSLKCFEETHAFKYQWSTSFTQMKFLQALHIDSRNILCGPWNKMNKINFPDTSYSFEISTHNVDAFSSSNSTRNKDMIPDAHFDWITSGLINPLQGTNGKEIIHSLEENNVTEILKSRSRDVLSSLPNLNFLKLTYISFK